MPEEEPEEPSESEKAKELPEEPDIPDGLTEGAERARQDFMKTYNEALRVFGSVSLNILVWGPNPKSETPVGRKRREIRQALIKCGHNAMFSEEIPDGDERFPLQVKELAQARAAHVIIALVEESSALNETHDFCAYPDLAHKFLVLAPVEQRQRYSGQTILSDLEEFGGVRWYESDELKSCNVLSTALKRVTTVRNMVIIQEARGGRL